MYDVGCVPEQVDDSLDDAVIINPGSCNGRVFFVFGLPVPDLSFLPDSYCVGVFRNFLPDYAVSGERLCAIISEVGGFLSHGAIVAREFGIPYVVIPKATERFFFGDHISISSSGLVRRESEFFTSGHPPYPTERHYSIRVYRYSLALFADWMILRFLRGDVKTILLFGDTYALDVPPSEYYTAVKRLRPGDFDPFIPMVEKLSGLQYLLLVNMLQRAPHAISPRLYPQISPHLLREDARAREYFVANLQNESADRIVYLLRVAAESLARELSDLLGDVKR